LVNALAGHEEGLCTDCRRRLERNPLRVLDCKNEGCREISEGVPTIIEFLCDECRRHFESVTAYLRALGLAYEIDHRIVRGLDYYTKTVFEVVHSELGAKDVLGGGGRYDGLAEDLGGEHTPGVGFAAGIERAVMVLKAARGESSRETSGTGIRVFVVTMGDAARAEGFKLVNALRGLGVASDLDYMGRSLRAQMKHADRCGARKVVILGEEELKAGVATVKDMATGEQTQTALEGLAEALSRECRGLTV